MDGKLWCTPVPITENLSYDSVEYYWNIIMEYMMEYYSALKQGNSDNATS